MMMTSRESDIRERLAAKQHRIWSHWMEYLFSVSLQKEDGSYMIPADKASRWLRLMKTPYDLLTEDEKASDREQADKILEIL